jgi:hypothetical protein
VDRTKFFLGPSFLTLGLGSRPFPDSLIGTILLFIRSTPSLGSSNFLSNGNMCTVRTAHIDKIDRTSGPRQLTKPCNEDKVSHRKVGVSEMTRCIARGDCITFTGYERTRLYVIISSERITAWNGRVPVPDCVSRLLINDWSVVTQMRPLPNTR